MPPPPRPSRYDTQQDTQETERNRQQTERDRVQSENIRNLQNQLTGVESQTVAQGDETSTLQRLRIHIPNPYTHFLLGQRFTGDTPFGYTGASLQTDENLFVDIKKNSVLQAKGFMLLQTQNIWQQYAQQLMELSSPTAVKVVGGQVFLGSISSPVAPAFNGSAGENLTSVTPNNLAPLITALTDTASSWDTVATILGLVYTGVFLTKPSGLDGWIQIIETAGSSLKDIFGMIPDSGPAAPAKDVNIYGESGINVVSPKKILITTKDELKTFAGKDTGITSRMYSTLQAGIGAKCFGGMKASVEAGAYAEVKAGRIVGIASLRGKVEAKGKTIEVGTHVPDLAQVATESIELKAKDKIGLDSQKEVEVKTGTSTKVEAKENVEVKAEKAVHIQVGPYCIEIKPEGIKIGKGSNGTPSDPLVHIKDDKITLSISGMGMQIEDKRVHIGKAGTNMSVADSGNIFIKGKIIKLG
jgi:hypothetical protein